MKAKNKRPQMFVARRKKVITWRKTTCIYEFFFWWISKYWLVYGIIYQWLVDAKFVWRLTSFLEEAPYHSDSAHATVLSPLKQMGRALIFWQSEIILPGAGPNISDDPGQPMRAWVGPNIEFKIGCHELLPTSNLALVAPPHRRFLEKIGWRWL